MSEQEQNIPSLKSQSAWLLFAKVVGYFFAFLLPLLVVRFFTLEQVGTYRFIFQVIMDLVGILPLGVSMSVYYYLSREKEDRPRTIINILLFNFAAGAAACAVLFFFPQILGLISNNEEIIRLAPKAGIVVWLWIFGIFLEVVAVANREPKIATTFIILSQFTKTLFMTCAVVIFTTVDSILYAAMVQAALQIVILLWYLNSRFPKYWTTFQPAFFKRHLVYALPFGFAGVLWIMQSNIHNYFVEARFSPSQYAIYAYGCFEFPLITMLYESISSVLIPRMSELQSRGETAKIIETAVSAMNKIALTFLPIFAFLMILAAPLFITLFTEKFLESVPIFKINILLLPLYVVMLDPIARAYEEVGRFLLKFRAFLLIGIIGALWFGIQNFDLRGMIGIVVASIVFERIVTFIKIRKLLDLKFEHVYRLKTIGKIAAATTIAAAVLFVFYWVTKDTLFPYCLAQSRSIMTSIGIGRFGGFFGGSVYLGICALIFGPVYYFTANAFSVIDDDEKEFLRKVLRQPFDLAARLF
ncbi:MAG: oligosaccharide flippase family protein [Pyrinomonadaceae bacterium]